MKDAFAVLVLTVVFFVFLAALLSTTSPSMPQCQEDQVLVGQGDFHNGRYQWYQCGPALDDFAG